MGGHAAAVGAIGTLAFLAYRQSGVYRDAETLYQATLERNPDSSIAHSKLVTPWHARWLDEAMAHYRKALEIEPDLRRGPQQPRHRLGRAGRPDGGHDALPRSFGKSSRTRRGPLYTSASLWPRAASWMTPCRTTGRPGNPAGLR